MSTVNKRELLLSLARNAQPSETIPAAFFLHFDPACHRGRAAIDRHLEYFRYTGMDFVKIQYEHPFPLLKDILEPDDWTSMPLYGEDYYADQLEVVEGIVRAANEEALVVVTLYSPFMFASQTAGNQRVVDHLSRDPDRVGRGLKTITESMLYFVRGCVERGVDGFYASTQGGESGRLTDKTLFVDYIKPYDLSVWREIEESCVFNILHVCDYHGQYEDLEPYVDYPGSVVNCGLELVSGPISATAVSKMFGRPYMGGMDRHGVIVSGSEEEIRAEVISAIEKAPERFILAADCTLPSDIDWKNIRTAVDAAHRYQR